MLTRRIATVLLTLVSFSSGSYWVVTVCAPHYVTPVGHEFSGHAFLWIAPDPATIGTEHWVVMVGFYAKWSPTAPHWVRAIGGFSIGAGDLDGQHGRQLLLKYARFPLWFLPIACGLYPAFAFMRGPLRRWHRRTRGRCECCGYCLTGNVSGVCPECGTPATRSRNGRRLSPALVAFASLLAFVALASAERKYAVDVPVENVFLLCSPCGLEASEVAWLIDALRETDMSEEEILQAFNAAFPHDESLHDYCLQCAEVVLEEARKCDG